MPATPLERDQDAPPGEEFEARGADERVESAGSHSVASRCDYQEFPCIPSPTRHPLRALFWLAQAAFGLICGLALLAIAAATPVVNVLALGYLMEVQGRVARTGKLRSAFYLLPAAGKLGLILLAVWLWLLPIHFLAGLAHDAWLLAPGGTAAWLWTGLLVAASLLIAAHLMLAMGCGGGWWRFVRPISNVGRLLADWRRGNYWHDAHQAIREFVAAFRLPSLLHLGLLGYSAAYLWLVAPVFLFTLLDDVTSRWQVLAFIVGSIALTIMLLPMPLLLAHVAAERRWRAMFELSTAAKLAGQTPFRWAITTAILFATSSLPLLYTALFKIRIPPHDAQWDLMLIFLVTVAPARVLVGWSYHRATQRPRREPSWLWRIWQAVNALALCAGVGFYVYFLNLAATGGELGRRAVWQLHALLLPFPF